jgi:nucleoside-diphosphate-sugar epimerase
MNFSCIFFAFVLAADAFQPTAFLGSKLVSSSIPSRSGSESTICMMKTIAVFGASGLTASECVYQALSNGDSVIGLTRNPEKLVIPKGSGGSKAGEPLSDPKLKVFAGDVTKMTDVEKVFAAGPIDGVIVALGGKTSDVGTTMLQEGTSNVISAMKANGVKRIAVVTSIGTGDSERQAPFFFKILMMTVRENYLHHRIFSSMSLNSRLNANSTFF